MARNKGWIFVAAGIALLAGLFVLFRPAPPPAAAGAPAAAPAPAPPQTFELVIRDGRLVSGPATLQVMQGDLVALVVTSDRADELHLHGYDLHLALRAGVPAQLLFTADRSGRFEYELHQAHAEVGALEVQPK